VEGKGAGADGIDKDEMVAGGAGVGAGEVEGEEEGEPAEGGGRAMAVGGAEGEGVVGAAVGAGGPGQGAQHGGSLCTRRPGRPAARAAAGRHGTRATWAAGGTIAGRGGRRQGATRGPGGCRWCDEGWRGREVAPGAAGFGGHRPWWMLRARFEVARPGARAATITAVASAGARLPGRSWR